MFFSKKKAIINFHKAESVYHKELKSSKWFAENKSKVDRTNRVQFTDELLEKKFYKNSVIDLISNLIIVKKNTSNYSGMRLEKAMLLHARATVLSLGDPITVFQNDTISKATVLLNMQISKKYKPSIIGEELFKDVDQPHRDFEFIQFDLNSIFHGGNGSNDTFYYNERWIEVKKLEKEIESDPNNITKLTKLFNDYALLGEWDKSIYFAKKAKDAFLERDKNNVNSNDNGPLDTEGFNVDIQY